MGGAIGIMVLAEAIAFCSPHYNQRRHNVLGGRVKLANEELDALLAKAGLRLVQEYSPRCGYRKTEWLRASWQWVSWQRLLWKSLA